MKLVYASRKGHVEAAVEKLGLTDVLKIVDGTEKVEGDYIIFTYTDGNGETPKIVEEFLKNNPSVKGVISSGNKERHPNTYNFASDNISKAYNVPIIAKLEDGGTDEELAQIKEKI